MALTSPRFAANHRLQRAAQNNPPLRRGNWGPAVRLLQQALIDSGIPLPISVKRYGSPDGNYGDETYGAVRRYQSRHTLGVDGIAGRQTLGRMDELLRGPASPLPRLPSGLPYTVPGTIDPHRQRNSMSCWAASYTMLLSWRRQQSLSVVDAVTSLGPSWVSLYNTNAGLPPNRCDEFARVAGLTAEPLYNPTIQGWVDLLRHHGLLWTVYGWRVVNINGKTQSGLHAVIIYGIYGDESDGGTTVRYVDPGDGRFHEQTYGRFWNRHETGFTVGPSSSAGYSQIVHF